EDAFDDDERAPAPRKRRELFFERLRGEVYGDAVEFVLTLGGGQALLLVLDHLRLVQLDPHAALQTVGARVEARADDDDEEVGVGGEFAPEQVVNYPVARDVARVRPRLVVEGRQYPQALLVHEEPRVRIAAHGAWPFGVPHAPAAAYYGRLCH